MALICRDTRFWSETFCSLMTRAGTSLFLPSTMPASNQPVETISSCKPCLRLTVGSPQPATTSPDSRTKRRRGLSDAHMRAILEHSPLHALECLFARDLAGQKRQQIAAPDADKNRPGGAV